MVNFGQKTAIFDPWNFAQKKNTTEIMKYCVKPQWFQKNWLSIWWNHFWFHDNMTFFKISLIIAVWRVKVARFENENDDVFQFPIRLRMKNVAPKAIYRSLKVIFYNWPKSWIFTSSKNSLVDRSKNKLLSMFKTP